MGWFGSSRSDAELKEASAALSAMFAPHHATLPASASTPAREARPTSAAAASAEVPRPASVDLLQARDTDRHMGSGAEGRAWWGRLLGRREAEDATVKGWRAIPPSPIQGYEVGPRGLTDVLATPPRLLSSRDVREMVTSLSGIEETARYAMDVDFPVQMGHRGRRGMELVVHPVLLLTGLYLMTWKTAALYRSATPRQSLFLTKLLAVLRAPLPAARRSRLRAATAACCRQRTCACC
ncbi:hypothetical protein STCU_09896 [Strigomonas culicis]|uniref:Uncharacterized protein n=1 Tax=Strigomonas culicis TaxID=28005 RepID=S9V6H0_9TRYP|nr:hypothetical protein STCU_09896 [Strigomonas culicis]|eukprot:EPY18515.1 hypothetical protein STCU_09896 [Strigomonas culicis]